VFRISISITVLCDILKDYCRVSGNKR